ncbi:sodium:solute symporter family transporter [Wenyingzhuangia aestuarii]|uniref:sodium:solute symporter family transporter n=1 Tax=Wenyingzhuangia aestuarii TaxID=1647582 RepID=UPI001439CC3C|nr:sodium:solute symporter [Wenyingzhuangia aestuarii]NJB83087.1 Na+/proline symporter [Wenyingzhuangia aestuarii]
MNIITLQWSLVIGSSLLLFLFSPFVKTSNAFYKATSKLKSPTTFVLTGSLVISWIFSKSITNAANLGLAYGIVGGLAYAAYYLSFVVAGVVIYYLRTKGGFTSIHHFIYSKYGQKAINLFSILIAFRLFNEVWSNTMVIGSYFGDVNSNSYYIAIVVFTILTLAYSLKGGLSSSIFTDIIQMGLFSVLLGIILWQLFSITEFTTQTVLNSGDWSFNMGLNLLFAAVLQSFSYPFHDPVLTDRGFISKPKTTLKSFIAAGIVGFICIALFSVVGIYAKHMGLQGQAAVQVGKTLGVGLLVVINFIMITSASSTLDSTFSSFSKLIVIDLKKSKSVSLGRLVMILLAILGTIPIFLNAEVLTATTISGTMVIGLTPIFMFWHIKAPKLSFFLSLTSGLLFGFLLLFNLFPTFLILTQGPYADLLWVNVWGILLCTILYWTPIWMHKK